MGEVEEKNKGFYLLHISRISIIYLYVYLQNKVLEKGLIIWIY